ncbi:GUN4 domain-containing protein [Aliinostoc sp. HNIBRCY26]|uniref:GUN4 domain-containing protein n=1 Tax=Aliinostoc sp. HNIBRCY26 TaxID=3418997 RepID=UPI003D00056A
MCPIGVRTSNSTVALETGTAKLWLLLVGVNQYQDEQIPSLRYPAVDCQGLGMALDAATQGFPERELKIYHDFGEQPLLENVRLSLKTMAAATKPNDTILFYFSGHGMLEPSSKQVVLCLQDTQTDDLINTGLNLQELLQVLADCAAGQQLVWLDACHSGNLSFLGARGEISTELNPTPELVELLRQRASKQTGFYALLSCDRQQQSWEFPQLGHGVFTYYLIRGLRGEAADSQGIIAADSLYRYVYQQTVAYIQKANQQLRVINQLKKGRGENSIHAEYPSQTPKRIVEGVGEVILGIKPLPKGITRHPRQALIVEGLPKNNIPSALCSIFQTAGDFTTNSWTVGGKNASADIHKAIQKCLLSESFAESSPDAAIGIDTATVLLYLRGNIQETPSSEAIFVLANDITINRSWLRKQLRRCTSQQIIILDCPGQAAIGVASVREWVEELQLGTDIGQCLIACATPATQPEQFAKAVQKILTPTTPHTGLTAAGLITQLQLDLAATDNQLYFWLSGSQGIIEVLPETTLVVGESVSQNQEDSDDLSSSVGVDYTTLRDLLKAQRWLEADGETTNLMLKVAHREQQGQLDLDSLANFPRTDLFTIDKLWVKYSQGRFGFSVQQRIWQSLQGNSPNDPVMALMIGNKKAAAAETCIDFGHRVRWREKDAWVNYTDFIADDNAPAGYLPYYGFFAPVWRVKVLGVWEWHSAIATASWWQLCEALLGVLSDER